MGFFKTLFTGVRDNELNEEEREQFEEFQKNEIENVSTLDIDLIINYIQKIANENELTKIQNAIALREDGIEQIENKVSQKEVTEVLTQKDTFENESDGDSEVSNKISENSSQNTPNQSSEEMSRELNRELNKEIDSELEFEEDLDDDEYVDLDDEYIDDTSKSQILSDINESQNEEEFNSDSQDSFDDPTLFSIVHDELMELFKEGQIVLLKEEFSFPTLGKRETLAFGIFNLELSDNKEQTHWFVQNLKQFSRLKECKMLLSKENEKDLILEVGDKHAILVCFKTNDLVTDEFVFNREWN